MSVTEITTAAQLRALLRRGSSYGDGSYRVRAEASGVGYLPIETARTISAEFDDGFLWTGPTASAYPAVGVNAPNVHLYGGKVTNPHGGSGHSGGDGVKVGSDLGPTNLRWWGLVVDGAAAQGFSVQGSNYPIRGDVIAEATRAGLNTSLDPHSIPGTGLHAAYIGGGTAPTSGRFDLYVHDQATGSGVQAGANLRDAVLDIRAVRMTWPYATAGAAFQPWGSHNGSVVVRSLSVDHAQYGIYAEYLSSGAFGIASYTRKNVNRPDVLTSHVTVPA